MATNLNKSQINKIVKFCRLASRLTNSIPGEKVRNKWPDPTWKTLDPWDVYYGLKKDVVSGGDILRGFEHPHLYQAVKLDDMIAFYNKFEQYLK